MSFCKHENSLLDDTLDYPQEGRLLNPVNSFGNHPFQGHMISNAVSRMNSERWD